MDSLEDINLSELHCIPDNIKKEISHFNVFRLDDFICKPARAVPYNRRNYYKISFIIGKNRAYFADKMIESDGQVLLFANPQIPYSWEPLDDEQSGFFCIFTEAFFDQFGNIKSYPMFQPGGNPVFVLPDNQLSSVKAIYTKMLTEIQSDYTYKYDVLRNLTFELIHLALKLQPVQSTLYSNANAATRISSMFMELLERQFPIESPIQQVLLRSPAEFASQLAVHVNHLNRALKETTGQTTSQLISARILQESRALLKHTNWNISEIAWCLGFEELSHFINFFKKNVSLTPKTFRSNK